MGLVHRDVSPQNVLISQEGDIKLCDFGIAKAASKASHTQVGALKGKLQYMSPEQASGKPIDRRSDIFALGTVLFEMLTGRKLFTGDNEISILEQVREARVVPPSQFNDEVTPEIDRVVFKALREGSGRALSDRRRHGARHRLDPLQLQADADERRPRDLHASHLERRAGRAEAREAAGADRRNAVHDSPRIAAVRLHKGWRRTAAVSREPSSPGDRDAVVGGAVREEEKIACRAGDDRRGSRRRDRRWILLFDAAADLHRRSPAGARFARAGRRRRGP